MPRARSKSRSGWACDRDTECQARERPIMKRIRWWLCVALAGCLFSGVAVAKDDPAEPGTPSKAKKARPTKARKPRLPGIYAHVPKVCEMTEAETAAFTKALQPYLDARKAQRPKMAELRKASAEARKAGDKDKAKELSQQARKINDDIKALGDKAMDTLTDEQKAKWQGHLLYMQMMRMVKKTGVDEKQSESIRTMCQAQGKAYGAMDDKAKRTARAALVKEIKEKVLTEEQRAKLVKPANKKPAKKKPAKDKPAKTDTPT